MQELADGPIESDGHRWWKVCKEDQSQSIRKWETDPRMLILAQSSTGSISRSDRHIDF